MDADDRCPATASSAIGLPLCVRFARALAIRGPVGSTALVAVALAGTIGIANCTDDRGRKVSDAGHHVPDVRSVDGPLSPPDLPVRVTA